ncbi:hypothetical protein B7990_14650 [Fibrobacter sp. UWB4]|uniref:YobI family P-loop NTPase n=1 Tax=Fibrobacter sp. UWB4 TaxID=1964356 RepID=UPI000B52794F|nr:hypothetical protein [Fibrobacter sp. UWB4]OWV15014.1 hypothetical protein B7990_14650 [Fibrobacter sp. UWB4]
MNDNRSYKEIPFQNLAPIDNVKDEVSFKALDYALSEKKIHNVALTGNYGSGKSSVLASYIKQQKDKHQFLNVSLATFAVEKKDEKTLSSQKKLPKTTIHAIEKSILQQIFYTKSGECFPFSRFNRVKNIDKAKRIWISIFILIISIASIVVAKTNFEQIKLENVTQLSGWSIGLLIVAVVGIIVAFIGLYQIIPYISRIGFTKIFVPKAEIELGKKDSESLLNKHLDEILYFFEVTDYDVVIFEDLDRFKNTEIFIKLRELNTLLNNYENVKRKRKIVFIYALRDEVFRDSSRTKFFDFIIPVIPVISNQNSGDVLVNLRKQNKESVLKEIDENFLEDIGLYVDDMRLLKNSVNEFKIYDQKINVEDYKTNEQADTTKFHDKTSRDRNKIFALVLYKNLYPKDFADLICNKGELYEVFKEKKQLAGKKIQEIQKKIPPLEAQIEVLEKQALKNVKELRVLYVATVFSKSSRYSYDIEDLYDYVSDEKFEEFWKQGLSSHVAFLSAQEEIDPQYTYDQREKMIKDKSNEEIAKIKKQIDECRNAISDMEQKSIKDMLLDFPEMDFVSKIKSPQKKEFVDYLLRHGYIDENYSRYISYFYGNSLSENDTRYLRLIKNNQAPNDVFLELSNFGKVVKRIQKHEWKYFAVLNLSLLKYLLQIKDRHLDYFLNTLWKYKQQNSDCTFLSALNVDYGLTPTLYNKVYKLFNDKNNWLQVLFEKESNSVRYKFFRYTDFEEKKDDVVNFLSKDVSFLYDPDVEDDKEFVAEKFDTLNLKFNLLNDTPEYPIYDILLEQNAYVISKQNFDIIVNHALGNDFNHPINDYYTQVSKMPNKKVKAYVDENIEDFVDKVMLSSGKNIAENEDAFVELLNMENLSRDTKAELIKKNDCEISDLTKVSLDKLKSTDAKQMDLCELLFARRRVKLSWKNVFESFKHNGNTLKEYLKDYLRDKKIVGEIVESVLLTPDDLNNGNNEIAHIFYQSLLTIDKMPLECFSSLISMCPWKVDDFELTRFSQEKMNYLIESGILKFTAKNYELVRSQFLSLIPKYVGLNFDEFIAACKNLYVSFEILRLLLDSSELDNEQKKILLSTEFNAWQDLWRLGTNCDWLGKKVIELGYTGKIFVPLNYIVRNLDNALDVKKFISLQEEYLKNNEIADFIYSKGLDLYRSCISKNGKNVKVPNTPEDLAFVKVLKKKGLIAGFDVEKDSIVVTQLSPNQ